MVKSTEIVYEVVGRFFDIVVQAVSAAGATSGSVGVSLMACDLLSTGYTSTVRAPCPVSHANTV